MHDDLGNEVVTSYINFIIDSLNTKYGDNKDFIDKIKRTHAGIMLNISLNSLFENNVNLLQLLDETIRTLEEKNDFIIKELDSYDTYDSALDCFLRKIIEVCKKYPEESKPVIKRLINFKNENVRTLCYLSFVSDFDLDFAFSQDDSPRVRNLYKFIHDVNAWLADFSVRSEDKMLFYDFSQKVSKCTFYRRKSLKEGDDGIMTAYYHMRCEDTVFAYNLYATLEELQLYEDFKRCDNENLCEAKAYLFYELISSNKIELIGDKPSFIKNQKGFGRKLLPGSNFDK